jgi:hypothetical protein
MPATLIGRPKREISFSQLIANQGQNHLHAGQNKAGAHDGISAARPLVAMATITVAPTIVCMANQYAEAMVRMMEGSHFAPWMPKTMRHATCPVMP